MTAMDNGGVRKGQVRDPAGDLDALSDLSLATVSEHLKVLRKSGLLILSKQGRFWFCRTDIGSVRAVASAVAQLEGTQ